jgi:hypothetical protein
MPGFEQGEMWWGRLSPHGVWQVIESAKDLFLGVDPPGQHVPPLSAME